MSWPAYEQIVQKEWGALLESSATKEEAFQDFFERHPCMMPGLDRLHDYRLEGILPPALISQPKLPGLGPRIPDFLWITHLESSRVTAVFIEIEAPAKRWATRDDRPTAELTQAIDQIKQWQEWFSHSENASLFQRLYRIPSDLLRTSTFKQKYILIYGRRDEATENEAFARRREFMQRPEEEFMTYDRLKPNGHLVNCPCVRLSADGHYRVLHVPPTLSAFPGLTSIEGVDRAIRQNQCLSWAQKHALLQDLGYMKREPGDESDQELY